MFGFNSAGYDVKLIKKFLFKELCEHGQQPNFTGKKVGKYPCIKTEHLKFMDILQFLAPGYNLKSFFKAFGVSKQKGFFPYAYFTHVDQLDETTLVYVQNFFGGGGWQAVSLGGGVTVMEKREIFVGWVTKVCLKCTKKLG